MEVMFAFDLVNAQIQLCCSQSSQMLELTIVCNGTLSEENYETLYSYKAT